jgi:hypothetical protein
VENASAKRKEFKMLGVPLAREMRPGESNMFLRRPGEEEEKKGPGMKSGGKVGSSCMKSGGKVGGAMKGGDMPFFASKAKDKMASKKKPARKPMTNYASGGMVKADHRAIHSDHRQPPDDSVRCNRHLHPVLIRKGA